MKNNNIFRQPDIPINTIDHFSEQQFREMIDSVRASIHPDTYACDRYVNDISEDIRLKSIRNLSGFFQPADFIANSFAVGPGRIAKFAFCFFGTETIVSCKIIYGK